jgi:hypothetical protein
LRLPNLVQISLSDWVYLAWRRCRMCTYCVNVSSA